MFGQPRDDFRRGAPKIEIDRGTGSVIEDEERGLCGGVVCFDCERHVDQRSARDAPCADKRSTGGGQILGHGSFYSRVKSSVNLSG